MSKSNKLLILFLAFALLLIPVMSSADITVSAAGNCGVNILAFLDTHANGEQTDNENGVQGVEVKIIDKDGNVAASGKTGADGMVRFAKLSPGQYTIHFVTPVDIGYSKKGAGTGLKFGCIDTQVEREADIGPINLKSGETVERGLALMPLIHMSGFCWMDTNGNGIRETGEPMVSGVKITADGQKNGLHYETLSNADGKWVINQIKPGFYTLTAYAPSGMMFTRYSKTGGDNRSIFTEEGKSKASKTVDTNDKKSKEKLNIGFMEPTGVSGICFIDANYNGVYDKGEKPLAGVKVTAIKQVKDVTAAETKSALDGKYALNELRGNTFKIKATLPDDGSVFTRVSTAQTGNRFEARTGRRESVISDFVLKDGQRRELNIGAVYPSKVSGTAYLDDNFSGTMNGSEKTVSGLSVSLLNKSGGVVNTVKTNAKGQYSFENVMPGTYSLSLTALPGYAFTRNDHDSIIVNRQNGEGCSEPFEVKIGENVGKLNIGMIRPAAVKGRIFADNNDNGIQDEGEKGFVAASVKLVGDEGEAFSCKPDMNGDFVFDAVMPGKYHVEYELPGHTVFAQVKKGGNTVSASGTTGKSDEFRVNSGDVHEVALCGAVSLGSVSGTAFRDHAATGVMEDGSERLAGVKITMTPERQGLEPAEITTGPDGVFALEDLRPGKYTLSVSLPDGLVLSRTGGLGLPLRPGLNEQSQTVSISAGKDITEQHLGAVGPASLSGQIWLDENNNGKLDKGEATPAGMRIDIHDDTADADYGTLETDEKGGFSSEGMIPGEYTLSMKADSDMDGTVPGDSDFKRDGDRFVLAGLKLGEGDDRSGLRLGYIRYSTISGKVLADESGEMKPLSGASLTLSGGGLNQEKTAKTGADGKYSFDGLLPGEYTLKAAMPKGYLIAEPDDERLASGGLTSVITREIEGRGGLSDPVAVKMTADAKDRDIVAVLPGRLGDYCWLDENGNGLQDTDEPGIPGVKIKLMRRGKAVAETVSDQYGFYRFSDVYPAVYTLSVTMPGEVIPTKAVSGYTNIISILKPTDGTEAESAEVTVISNMPNYDADLGFVLREAGKLPQGINAGKTQNWTKIIVDTGKK